MNLDQINIAVKDRFQALRQRLGAACYAKQDSQIEQRGHLKDLRTQATSVLTRVVCARAEASDTTCVMAYAELASTLQAMDVPAVPSAAAGALLAVQVLETPVSTACLSVQFDAMGALAAIGRLEEVQVSLGWFVTN